MSLPKKIVSNTAVQMVGRITTALMALISVKLITSTLGVEGYGVYATIYEFLGLFAIAGDFGIYTVALREMSSNLENPQPSTPFSHREKGRGGGEKISFIYQNIMGMRIVLMTIVMGIAIITAYLIPQYEGTLIPIGVIITAIAVFANLVFSMATSILQLHLKMEYGTYALVVGKIISVAIIAYGAFFTEGGSDAFFIFLWAGVFGHLIMLGISLIYAKRYTEIIPKFDLEYWKEIFIKAAPYGVALILGTIYFKINVTFLSLLRSNEEVGIFAVGIRIIEVFTVLPIFFMNSILPSLSREIERDKGQGTREYVIARSEERATKQSICCASFRETKNERRSNLEDENTIQQGHKQTKLHALLNFSFQFMLITGLPLVLGTHLISKEIITLVSSEEFVSGHKYLLGGDFALELLIVAMFFSFFSNFISVCFVAFQKQNKVLFINLLGVIINVILNWIYIPKYGFPAAGIVSIISEAIIFISGFILFQQTYKFIPKLSPIIKTFIAGISMFIIGIFIKQIIGEGLWQSLVIMITCGFVYGIIIWKSGALCKKDIEMIKMEN